MTIQDYPSCRQKQKEIKTQFASCSSEDAKYQMLIDMGRALPRLDSAFKTPQNVVKGCQSTMYLHSYVQDGLVYFEAESDALISSGLAAILIKAYSGETAESILKCPPDYLEELGICANLTPNRANGLYSIHLKMKQEALKSLLE